MTRFGALGLLFAALGGSGALTLSCAEQEERPPPATWQCEGLGCWGPPISGMLPDPGGGEGGTAGGGGASGDEESVTLSAAVGLLSDDAFERADPFGEIVDLRAEAPEDRSVVGVYTGNTATFELEGVLRARAVWVYGKPRSAASLALATLEPMRADNPDSNGVVHSDVPFVLARASVIDEIFTLASTPVLYDASKGQLVLQLVSRGSPAGARGVEVTAPQAEIVMYAINGTFSDVPQETDATGLVFLGNVSASGWPGRAVDVSFSGAVTSAVTLPAVSGAVTIAPVSP